MDPMPIVNSVVNQAIPKCWQIAAYQPSLYQKNEFQEDRNNGIGHRHSFQPDICLPTVRDIIKIRV